MLTRTLVTSTIKLAEIQVIDGEVHSLELEPMVVSGNVDVKKATRLAQKHYKGKQVAVLDIEKTKTKYAMKVEDFIANAEIVE